MTSVCVSNVIINQREPDDMDCLPYPKSMLPGEELKGINGDL